MDRENEARRVFDEEEERKKKREEAKREEEEERRRREEADQRAGDQADADQRARDDYNSGEIMGVDTLAEIMAGRIIGDALETCIPLRSYLCI
jgi:hypothetical protein